MSATGRDELPDAKLILKLLRIGRLRDKGHCQLANRRTNVGNDAAQHSHPVSSVGYSAYEADQPWLTQPYNLPFKLVDVSDKHQLAATNFVALIFEVGNFLVLSFELFLFLPSGSFLWRGLLRCRCVPDGFPERGELGSISPDRTPSSSSLERD